MIFLENYMQLQIANGCKRDNGKRNTVIIINKSRPNNSIPTFGRHIWFRQRSRDLTHTTIYRVYINQTWWVHPVISCPCVGNGAQFWAKIIHCINYTTMWCWNGWWLGIQKLCCVKRGPPYSGRKHKSIWQMVVSTNGGTPKWMVYKGTSH